MIHCHKIKLVQQEAFYKFIFLDDKVLVIEEE
jgi:hypothetical protein